MSSAEKYTADIIQQAILTACNFSIPVFTDDQDYKMQKKYINIGDTKYTIGNVNSGNIGREGVSYIIRDYNVYLLSASLRGPFYSAISFLEEELGIYYVGGNVFLQDKGLNYTIKKSREYLYTPPFETRILLYKNAFETLFASYNRLNFIHSSGSVVSKCIGGNALISQWCGLGHTADCIIPGRKYYKTHPEYFAKGMPSNGGHFYSQLCLTNEDVFKIVKDYVIQLMKINPENDFFNFSINDVSGVCNCNRCKSVNQVEKSNSGTLVRFMNRLAKELDESYPNLKYITLSYLDYGFGTISRLRDNIYVLVSTDTASWSNPFRPINESEYFKQRINSWKNCTNNVFIWDYTLNFNDYLSLFPNLYAISSNLKYYKKLGVKGVLLESHYETRFVEDPELRSFVFSHLLYNPDCNLKSLINIFCQSYYGKSAPDILKYYNLVYKDVSTLKLLKENTYLISLSNTDFQSIVNIVKKVIEINNETVYKERVGNWLMPIVYSIIKYRNYDLTSAEYNLLIDLLEQLFYNSKIDRLNGAEKNVSGFIKMHKQKAAFFNKAGNGSGMRINTERVVDASELIVVEGTDKSIFPEIVNDSRASAGLSVRIPAVKEDWMVRFEPTTDFVEKNKNIQNIKVRVRVDAKAKKGHGFYFIVYDMVKKGNVLFEYVPLEKVSKDYSIFTFKIKGLKPNLLITVVPTYNPDVNFYFLDNLIFE